MRSSPGKRAAAAVLALCASAPASAHRRAEYLQATRVSVEPDRVDFWLDLTPGIAVAERVLGEIDADGNRSIDPSEGDAYAARLLSGIAVALDGTPLRLELVENAMPGVEAMLAGEGTMRVVARASLTPPPAGAHRLRYRNGHRPDIGAYLANALVPASDRVRIDAQRRDVDQRELVIEYTLKPGNGERIRGGISLAVVGALLWFAAARRRRPPLRAHAEP